MKGLLRSLELYLDGGVLRYRLSGGRPSSGLINFLSAHKNEITTLLKDVSDFSPGNPGQNGHNGQNWPFSPLTSEPAGNCVHSVHSVQGSREENGTILLGADGTAGVAIAALPPAISDN